MTAQTTTASQRSAADLNASSDLASDTPLLLATGCYSRTGTGRGVGVEILALTGTSCERRGTLEAVDPSFVLWSHDARVLLAVTETSPSHLLAIAVDPSGGELQLIGDLDLVGSGACHLEHGLIPGTVLVAHYGSGAVETVRLGADGAPVETVDHRPQVSSASTKGVAEAGDADADADAATRQAHPHQIVHVRRPDGTRLLAVPDLGLDRIDLFRQDPRGVPIPAGRLNLPVGSGPRHLVQVPGSGELLVACELNGTIALFHPTDAEPGWELTEQVPGGAPADGQDAPSHIALGPEPGTMLMARRGPDTLVRCPYEPLTQHGSRIRVLEEAAVGAHPRHFTVCGDLVLVAAQEADALTALHCDADGLRTAGAPFPSASVTCIAPRPARGAGDRA